jgi:hypothetical protein
MRADKRRGKIWRWFETGRVENCRLVWLVVRLRLRLVKDRKKCRYGHVHGRLDGMRKENGITRGKRVSGNSC